MPPRGKAVGHRGRCWFAASMAAWKMRMELVIRFGFGSDISWCPGKSEDGKPLLADLRAGQ
jgi:hypothetical protein